jgi:hypothetical protein
LPGRFVPQTPGDSFNDRFYFGSPAQPNRRGDLSPPPQSSPSAASDYSARASMPGDPNAETPLTRLLRLSAPNDVADPRSDPAVRFTDPFATLAALVRLSAMRDGDG